MPKPLSPLLLSALLLALVPTSAAAEVTGATVDKTGWWNRANTTTPTPAGPVTIPPPPGIPEDALAVGSLGDEPSAIAAIGIQPDVGAGATVERFTLRIAEDTESPSNQGTDGASIVACPITAFWAGGANGDWDTLPEHDCEAASVPGTRGDDGIWEFDLAPIGELWFDSFGTVTADGVVLRPGPEAPAPFQAVLQTGDGIDLVLEAQPGPDEGDPFATPGFDEPVATDSGLSNSGGGSGIINTPSITEPPGGSFDSSPSAPAPSGPDASGDEAPTDEAAAPPLAESPATEPAVSRAGELVGNFSPLVFLGLLVVAGGLVLLSYWFGPAGEPVTTVRQRGVSRALDARARAAKGTP